MHHTASVLMAPSHDRDLFFRGGGSVLKPNHITRYIYPSLCGYPQSCLRLQAPANSEQRSRPQGANSWGEDGHTFLTITRSSRPAPSEAQFTQWSSVEGVRDRQSVNPLGRAMARVTKYVGNTLLESGKFALKKGEPLVYVIKRTTVVPYGEMDVGKFGREEEEYVVECGQWRNMVPPTVKGHEHDSWWMRLHNLYQASFDRAFFHAREVMDNTLQVPPPLITWHPRPDIEKHVTVYRSPPPPDEAAFMDDFCFICSRDWFTESEYACCLKCKHFMCLECLTWYIDGSAGRGLIKDTEKDPNTKYFRCPLCKDINPITTDRADITRSDELAWWRWKISMRRMEKEGKDNWLTRLQTLCHNQPPWHREIPESWDQDRQANDIKVYVRYDDAVRFMQIPKKIWAMLPYGYSLDNPVGSKEALALEDQLKIELKRLAQSRKVFNTKELVEHMLAFGKTAITPIIVEDEKARLGNPIFPPGYQAYRGFLCEWTARGCFMCPMGQMDILGFMRQMEENKNRAWWKNEREVFFDP